MKYKFIDIHCHSALKPYSKSLKGKYDDYTNSANPKDESSIWYQDLPTARDILLNKHLTVTKFRQSDFKTSLESGLKIMVVSIDPMEKGFVFNKLNRPIKTSGKLLRNFVTGIGIPRIEDLQELDNYYTDLYRNYMFLQQLNETTIDVNGEAYRYRLVDRFQDIDTTLPNIIYIIMSIEGGHVLNTGLELTHVITDANEVLENAKKLKSDDWQVKPFYIALSHHFSNLLCGHAESFKGISKLAYDQKCDKNESISVMGYAVIDVLLKKDQGRRIFIDVKHMNLKSRLAYYRLLKTKYKHEAIPIIVSHGALNFSDLPKEMTSEINFYNEEIVEIGKSGGIFGIQLDERRLLKISSKDKKTKATKKSARILASRAQLVWRQVETMAILLYADDGFDGDPWGIQAIGSDFDGIIDPLNGYWTHKDYPVLADYLIKQAKAFLETPKAKSLPDYDSLSAEGITEKCMFTNAYNFFKTHL